MKRIWVQMRNNHDKIRRTVVPISTEIVMQSLPGFAVCALENGGMCFDEDGNYVDAIDVIDLASNSANVDVTNGDGDKGRCGVTYNNEEEDPEDELVRLIGEQLADEISTVFVPCRMSDEDDDDIAGIYGDHTDLSNIKIKDGDHYLGSGSRKHSDRGRNDHYKCLRNRGAGTKQQRFQD